MTVLAHTQAAGVHASRVTIGSVCKVAVVPANLTVCLWALTGLAVTALVVACVGSVDFADFLAAAGLLASFERVTAATCCSFSK
jgi:hypothetical protein